MGVMTKKRRNNGRNKKNRGHVKRVVCILSGKHIPKDKAVMRFVVRNIVEASAMRDIRDASVYENYVLPKVYYKQYYSIEAAIPHRDERVRSKEARRTVPLLQGSIAHARMLARVAKKGARVAALQVRPSQRAQHQHHQLPVPKLPRQLRESVASICAPVFCRWTLSRVLRSHCFVDFR